MKPIPKSILTHSATLTEVVQDEWQKETERTIAQLQHIRVEETESHSYDKDNRQNSLSAVLFFDCHNSRPVNVSFSEDQRIHFGDMVFRIRNIILVSDKQAVHHYELELE